MEVAANSIDDIIEIYKRDVDMTLIHECLRRTVGERLQALQDFSRAIDEIKEATTKARETA